MAKVNTQRRNSQQENNLLEALAANPPQGDNPQPSLQRHEAPSSEGNGKPQLSATEQLLLQQIERMNKEIDGLKGEQSMAAYVPPTAPDVGKPPVLDLSGLPDPVTEAAKYGPALAERVQQYSNASWEWKQRKQEAEMAPVREREGAIEGIWQDFAIQYPEIAEQDEEKVAFAAQQAVNKARKRGIDRDRYILGNTKKFLDDVAGEFKRLWPDGSEPSGGGNRSDANDDDGRTAGLFGGQGSGNRPSSSRQEGGSDMIKELQERQRKSGFF